MNILVSVIIITYNSSKTILQTLESIKNQTYNNIELIISDDCSKDNTISLCEDWIEKNKKRFIVTRIIESNNNTGIPANCNRALKEANGIWIKYIAGDDLLHFNAIENFILHYKGEEKIVAGYYQRFYNEEGKINLIGKLEPTTELRDMFNGDAQEQLSNIKYINFVPAPTVFIKRDIFSIIGNWDEKYKLMEDYPYWVKALKAGLRIGFFDELITYYRISSNSVTSHNSSRYYNINYYLCEFNFKKNNIYPLISYKEYKYWYNEFISRIRYIILTKIFKNKASRLSNIIFYFLMKISLK